MEGIFFPGCEPPEYWGELDVSNSGPRTAEARVLGLLVRRSETVLFDPRQAEVKPGLRRKADSPTC